MIALANDHSGIALKEEIKKLLDKQLLYMSAPPLRF